MTKEYLLVWIKIFPVCFSFVIILIFSIGELDNSATKVSLLQPLAIDELKAQLGHEYAIYLMDCSYEGENWREKCDDQILHQHARDIIDSKKYNYGNILIYFIYFLLSVSLSFQVTLLKIDKSKVKVNHLYISDWAINSAPILGVLGTVVSFSMLVGSSHTDSIQEVFKDSFFNAAITTILGGFIYVLNLFMNIFIQTENIDNK